MPENRTPLQMLEQIVNDAKAKQAAQAAAAARQTPDQTTQVLSQIGEHLQRSNETQLLMAQRIAALEAAGSKRNGGTNDDADDPYRGLSEFGIERSHLSPAIQHEARNYVKTEVAEALEKLVGPQVREAAALSEYQRAHPGFDLNVLNKYLATNEEVSKVVDTAREKGAYDLGIDYALTRMQLDEKIGTEARGRAGVARREQIIGETRPDAQIVGGTGANGDSRTNVAKQLTPEKLGEIYHRAESGDWSQFEKEIVSPNLPSEEYFQQLIQS